MPLTQKGQKIMANMKEQYGSKKGEQVFYASKNKGNISGVDAEAPPKRPSDLTSPAFKGAPQPNAVAMSRYQHELVAYIQRHGGHVSGHNMSLPVLEAAAAHFYAKANRQGDATLDPHCGKMATHIDDDATYSAIGAREWRHKHGNPDPKPGLLGQFKKPDPSSNAELERKHAQVVTGQKPKREGLIRRTLYGNDTDDPTAHNPVPPLHRENTGERRECDDDAGPDYSDWGPTKNAKIGPHTPAEAAKKKVEQQARSQVANLRKRTEKPKDVDDPNKVYPVGTAYGSNVAQICDAGLAPGSGEMAGKAVQVLPEEVNAAEINRRNSEYWRSAGGEQS